MENRDGFGPKFSALGHFGPSLIGPGLGLDFCALGWAGPGPNQKTLTVRNTDIH